jgi:alpha-acetolactate decarboxylase
VTHNAGGACPLIQATATRRWMFNHHEVKSKFQQVFTGMTCNMNNEKTQMWASQAQQPVASFDHYKGNM